jgi:hypothetical protein
MSVIMSEDSIVPFAPTQKGPTSGNGDPLDQAGQIVIGMLQQAAAAVSENCQHALGVAHKLSLQLRAAEDRIKMLEAEVRHHRDRAGRAEEWILRISREIDHKLLEPGRGRPQSRQDIRDGRTQQAAE